MATLSYITFTNHDASLTKKFKVMQGSYRQRIMRKGKIQETIEGGVDNQHGAHFNVYEMVIKVYAAVTDSTYGTKDNLVTFINYNVPPLDVITWVDWLGVSRSVFIAGDADVSPQVYTLDGTGAYFLVPVVLRETTAV